MSSAVRTALALAAVASAVSAQSQANKLPEKMTFGIIGDYGWTGWQPAPLHFCDNVMPKLQAAGITVPRELQNDCDAGDRASVNNATALQEDTAGYIAQVCERKGCDAFLSVGDNFYDSGIDFTTTGVLRFEEAWVNMYKGGVFDNARWYQCLGNHDIVLGQSGVDFETKIAPLYDDRWFFGTEQLPYYTYDLKGQDWTATFVVLDSDCFVNEYQGLDSVYQNPYTTACHQNKQVQVDFLEKSFAKSTADWKFIQLHHPYRSVSGNITELEPLIDIVVKHKGVVLNGHDHCLAHYFSNNTNFVLSGGAGYPQAGDCNFGVAPGPFAKFLGANSQSAANGFVTLDITREELVFEYYARDMKFEGGDLFPVKHDLSPIYSFTVKDHAI